MNIPAGDESDDLHSALVAADALEKFNRLPVEDRDRFSAWIAKARDEEARWRRIDILVLGMRMAPAVEAERRPLPERSGLWTNPMARG